MFPQIFGKYVLEREIASGGMAVVYLATLRGAGGFEKRLVLKQIRAELASDAAFVERFVAEAKMTVGLSHPNIVPVYELGVEQGVYFIAMELAQGVTLSDLLKTGGRLSPEEGAYLGVEVSRALDYAHRKAGIVHRDVTPRNVLIDEEGAVRLIDFGIAAPVSGEGHTRERVYGSPGHMPLEQLRGGRLTPATDVFAVGALLLEAWAAEPPFRRASKAESDAMLLVAPPPPSRADARLAPLDELLARTVAESAAERPQSTEELARPLREFLRSADLGDLARRLGDRVRGARRVSQVSVRPPAGTPGTPASHTATPSTARLDLPSTPAFSGTPSAPLIPPGPTTAVTRPFMQSVTETFAARDEVVEWTRPQSEPPDLLDDLLPTSHEPRVSAPPPPLLAAVPAPPRRGARATLIAVSVVLSAVAGATIASRTGPPEGAASATTQLVTEAPLARAEPPSPAGTPPSGLEGRPSLATSPSAAASNPTSGSPSTPLEPDAPTGAARRSGVAPSVDPPAGSPPISSAGLRGSRTSVPSASRPSPSGTPLVATPTAGLPQAPQVPPSTQTPAPAGSASPGADGDPRGEATMLAFTSDLPAQVSIDGAPQGQTPLRGVRRSPGRHVVTLVSATLGEHLTTTLELVKGRTTTVHAEFTRAVPALRVH